MSNPVGLQLLWNGKGKIINHHNEVPFKIFKEIKGKSLFHNNLNSTDNMIIHGDNLDGLKALLPYYFNSVKCIYIDPPYNTGMRQGEGGWVYSDRVDSLIMKKWFNKVVGGESSDYSRHTKWLCMMYPRLKLLHMLLKENGVIFISIDYNELHHLRLLLNEIFGENNYIETIIWRKKEGGGQQDEYYVTEHEYILVYAKNKSKFSIIEKKVLKRTDDYKYFDKKKQKGYNLIKLAKWGSGALKEDRRTMHFPIKNPDGKDSYPVTPDGRPGRWRYGRVKINEMLNEGAIKFQKKSGKWEAYEKAYEADEEEYKVLKQRSIFYDIATTGDGTNELKEIFGKKDMFPHPKPSDLIAELILLTTSKDDIVLDSFAGSGTTADAVLKINKLDDNRRRFILIQMDEGKEGEKVNICDKITYVRVKKAIKGYSNKIKNRIKKVKGLGGGLKYYGVNGTLKDEKGFINSLLSKEDLAKFIMFAETKESQTTLRKFSGDFKIGEKNNVIIYFIHDNKAMLDNRFLDKINYEELKEKGRFVVVYAYSTLLDDEYLEENKENLRFMQIPNDLGKIAKI